MAKVYEVTRRTRVVAESPEAALRAESCECGEAFPARAEFLGYQPANGTLVPYAAPPEGHRVHEVAETNGGEPVGTYYLAVPAGGDLPAGFGLWETGERHPTSGVTGAELLPAGCLIWEAAEVGAWAPAEIELREREGYAPPDDDPDGERELRLRLEAED